VYWNSRLEAEHKRVIDLLDPTKHVLADGFAGVGPFTIPYAKRVSTAINERKKLKQSPLQNVTIYANDLNPSSVEYLKSNVKLNKATDHVQSSCLCAREFLQKLVKEKIGFTHFVMNFPAGAPEFLDEFRGLYASWDGENVEMPIVLCYCFAREELCPSQPLARAARTLYGIANGENTPLNYSTDLTLEQSDDQAVLERTQFDKIASVRLVRNIAPKKWHVCVSFQLPKQIAFAK